MSDQPETTQNPFIAADAYALGYQAGIRKAAEIAAAIQPSSVSATGEAHMRGYRDAIVHEILAELGNG